MRFSGRFRMTKVTPPWRSIFRVSNAGSAFAAFAVLRFFAFAGFLVLAVVFYARRKRVRPSA